MRSITGQFVTSGLLLAALFLSGCEEFLSGLGGGQPEPDEGQEQEDDSGTGGNQASPNYEAEPGSCNDWKISYCEAVEECSAFSTSADCQLDLGYVRCHEDAPFTSCQERIDEAVRSKSCEELPDDCNPSEIADRSVPTRECRAIHDAICEFNLFCGYEFSTESCLASLETSSPCGAFTAVLPESEACIDAISTLGCSDPFPGICAGVLRY